MLGLDPLEAKASVLRLVPPTDTPSAMIPFTPAAKKLLERGLKQALGLRHKHIGTERLLLALAEEREGVAATVLREQQISAEQIREAVMQALGPDQLSPETEPVREMRHAIDLAWFDGIGTGLNRWGKEIRHGLDRDPDAGDLLLVLACAEGLAAETFRQLGLDVKRIRNAVEAARRQRSSRDEEIRQEIDDVLEAKKHALEQNEFVRASELRDRERELWEKLRGEHVSQHDVFSAVREHLGLPPQPGEPW